MLETSRIDVRILKAMSAFASKEEVRYYLNGVCIEIEPRCITYVATDGHRAIAYRDDSFDGDRENALLGTFIIPTEQCKAHKFKKADVTLGTIEYADSKFLTITYDDIGVTFKPIDGTFPDWRMIVRFDSVSNVSTQFNWKYAADFDKFAHETNLPKPVIAFNGQEPAPVVFGAESNVFGVLMPLRSDGAIKKCVPSWATRPIVAEAAE